MLFRSIISRIGAQGPAAGKLNVGERIMTVQGVTVEGPLHAARMLRESEGFMKIGKLPKRGDFDANGNVNLADPINILNYQFSGGAAPTCLKIMDIDDSGNIQLNDPVLLLTYLFSGGAAPSEPFDSCGIDPTEDTITCDSFDACP